MVFLSTTMIKSKHENREKHRLAASFTLTALYRLFYLFFTAFSDCCCCCFTEKASVSFPEIASLTLPDGSVNKPQLKTATWIILTTSLEDII